MKLKFDKDYRRSQPDPFVFADGGRFYMYVTARDGVEAYSSDGLTGPWHFEGIVLEIEGCRNFWAPCIIRVGEWYYLYTSCDGENMFEFLHVARAQSPLGPFTDAKCLFDRFSIDAHVVETESGLFLWYAEDNLDTDRIGTRVFVDRLLDPYTPACQPAEAVAPTMDEEIFQRNRLGDGRDWHTIEGAFWLREGDWQYVMYSGACFENDTYHIGYCAAPADETDLTRVKFVKHTLNGSFDPVMFKNEFEEGVGHHSVIKHEGQYYAIYHGRDLAEDGLTGDRRTARICKLHIQDGVITAECHQNRL